MDIGSGKPYPANALSNFAPHQFVVDGVTCASMEGFLQSLKFKDPAMQAYVCTLVGRAAKSKGRNKPWWVRQTLYWKGVEIDRHSKAYQDLLDRAFESLEKNTAFQRALLSTGNATLEHSIGKKNPHETILTRKEFTSRLTSIRVRLQKEREVS